MFNKMQICMILCFLLICSDIIIHATVAFISCSTVTLNGVNSLPFKSSFIIDIFIICNAKDISISTKCRDNVLDNISLSLYFKVVPSYDEINNKLDLHFHSFPWYKGCTNVIIKNKNSRNTR